MRSLVKYLLEWGPAIYEQWAEFAGQCGDGITGEKTDEGSWPARRLRQFLVKIYGETIPGNCRPPSIPRGGQRAAAARVVYHITKASGMYEAMWC
eukprot:1516137-Pyramimonas_sp.AAC.1